MIIQMIFSQKNKNFGTKFSLLKMKFNNVLTKDTECLKKPVQYKFQNCMEYDLFFHFNSLKTQKHLCVLWQTVKTGLQIRVHIRKLFSLFLIKNICCGYSKEPSQ